MCGIFAYLNYDVNRDRRYILQVLFNGLSRLEYRGYDSAGIAIDDSNFSPLVFRQEGNIESLVKSVYQGITAIHSFLFICFFAIAIVSDFYFFIFFCVRVLMNEQKWEKLN